MAATITVIRNGRKNAGSVQMVLAEMAADASYPTGGYLLTPQQFGLSRIDEIFAFSTGGYLIEYIEATGKIKVTLPTAGTAAFTGSALPTHQHALNTIDDAALVVAANQTTLAQLPAAVTYVYASAGGAVGPKQLVPNGVVPAAGQAAIDMTTGIITFAAADAITAAKCDFLPRNIGVVSPTVAVSAGTPAGTIAVTGAQGAEVANGTNLAGLTVISLIAIGA